MSDVSVIYGIVALLLLVGAAVLWRQGGKKQKISQEAMRHYGGPGISEEGDSEAILGIVLALVGLFVLGICINNL